MDGYRVKEGKPVIEPQEAEHLRELFYNFISGMGYKRAAETAEIGENVYHKSAKNMLMNRRYTGTGGYPKIISSRIFEQAQAEIQRRGELYPSKPKPPLVISQPSTFRMLLPEQSFDDPVAQAEYMYSLIDCEV